MEIETRLLEEWKANNELLKFYEDLKQKRFAHFLTIQTAFLAFFGIACEGRSGCFFHGLVDCTCSDSDSAAHHFFLLYAC